tara:strand:- start:3327 stop:4091 length:765 start_codon:yes stop_codon:yes gene_type:complete
MAQTPLVRHILRNVEARYPKLNQPYHYDTEAPRKNGGRGQTVPCSTDAPNAAWELGIRMDTDTAKEFMQSYAQAWQQSPYGKEQMPDPTVPQGNSTNPKILNEGDGFFVIKKIHKNCKSAQGKLQAPPMQVGRDAKPLADDFELTTGSTVNVDVTLFPHKISGNSGVSFWINSLQVVELAERQAIGSFSALDEPTETEPDNIFTALDTPKPKTQVKTRKKKPAEDSNPETNKTDLNDILSKFTSPPDSEVDDND